MTDSEALRAALLAGDHLEAWRIYRGLRDAGQADAAVHHLGGRAALGLGDPYGARWAMEAALAAGATGETLGQALLVLGETQRRTGDLSLAVETLQRFLADMPAQYPELGAMWRGAALRNLGLAYRQRGDLWRARDAYLQAADECRRSDLPDMLGRCLRNLAWVYCLVGQPEDAVRALDEAEILCPDDDARWRQQLGRAHAALCQGDPDTCLELSLQIVEAKEEDHHPVAGDVIAHAHWLAGRVCLAAGELQMAWASAEWAAEAAKRCLGDNRALQDAGDLRRQVLEAMEEAKRGA